jgi:hypothetical protein
MKHISIYIIAAFFLTSISVYSGEYPSDFEECANTLKYPKENFGVELKKLLKTSEYDKLIKTAKYLLAEDPQDEEAFALMAEAAYRVAEVESGNKDISSLPTVFIDDAGASDPIGYKLWHIHLKIGPNYWNDKAIVKYSLFLNCSIDKYIKYRPKFGGYISRKMAIAISSNNIDNVIKVMNQNPKIEGYKNPSIFYARFAERFIGVNDEINAAYFLNEVEKNYGLENKTRDYWHSIIIRNIDDRADINLSDKNRLKSEINKMMKNNS